MIVIASDHAGIELKARVLEVIRVRDTRLTISGRWIQNRSTTPISATRWRRRWLRVRTQAGILICGTGIGMSMTANRHPGVRAALCHDAFTAEMARRHNDANVLCIGARSTGPGVAEQMVLIFLETPFEAAVISAGWISSKLSGRIHDRHPQGAVFCSPQPAVEAADPEVAEALENERRRQNEGLELIASENFVSPAVMAAMGSVMTNKYAEGYPGRRYYGGCQYVDVGEELARERVKELFGAEHANVQPHSGAQANMGGLSCGAFSPATPCWVWISPMAVISPTVTRSTNRASSTRSWPMGCDKDTETIDYDRLRELAAGESSRS